MADRNDFNDNSGKSPLVLETLLKELEQVSSSDQEQQKRIKPFRYYFLKLIFFQFAMLLKYSRYNGHIQEIQKELKKLPLLDYIKVNQRNVFIFILFPLSIGIGASLYQIHTHGTFYLSYIYYLKQPLRAVGFFSRFHEMNEKASFAVRHFPIQWSDLRGFLFGYGISLLGSLFLSLHPAFSEEKRITNSLTKYGYVSDKHKLMPCEVTVIPKTVLRLRVEGHDTTTLYNDVKLFSVIRFNRHKVVRSKLDRTVFYLLDGFHLDDVPEKNWIFSFDDKNTSS